ncbi:MAG: A/G-specific adenine glycosylase [Archangium sp.]|nr:A/G-specific adenine glycosylase [Archangium sp.]
MASTTAVQRASAVKRELRPSLLAWFARSHRTLPWRSEPTPYAVWVSEVMLQQTQVDRVVPYFERFMARFPTVQALAAASVADVLSMWSGLGYYTRARSLHRAANEVMTTFGGALPDSVDGLLTLPGFGRYTAGAVASIAFGLEAPLVDGNVARVFSRLFEIDGIPGDKPREAMLWAVAEALVSGPQPGDFNQALMELGATVCVPANPLCLLCPVKTWCGALAHGRVDELPPPKRAAPRKELALAVAGIQKGDSLLLARRVEHGLFGGLWELPSAPLTKDRDGYTALQALLGERATIGPEVTVVERTLTHRALRLHLHTATLRGRLGSAPVGYSEWRWVERAELGTLGMSSATEAAVRAIAPPTQGTKPINAGPSTDGAGTRKAPKPKR